MLYQKLLLCSMCICYFQWKRRWSNIFEDMCLHSDEFHRRLTWWHFLFLASGYSRVNGDFPRLIFFINFFVCMFCRLSRNSCIFLTIPTVKVTSLVKVRFSNIDFVGSRSSRGDLRIYNFSLVKNKSLENNMFCFQITL